MMNTRRHLMLGGMALASMAVLAAGPLSDNASPAPRVVSLSWEATEHLLELGITPIAAADAGDYRTWYVNPALPPVVPNVGSRTEPNLELLVRMKPDLIIISPLLQDMKGRIERIAPVLVHDSFSQERDNLELQRQSYLSLARRLGREAQAQRRLKLMDERIAGMRALLAARFGTALPAVAVIRFSSPTVVFFNGPNSMPQHALELLGLAPAHRVTSSAWGITQASITALGQVKQGVVLHIEPFTQQDKLFATQLWQAMPFVKAKRFAALPSIWTYGGVFSIERLADSITQALLKLDAA
ncbi:MAG: ABC transporter substrate-binding protein [Polaromonas sp.]|nr:ABC transporter substrate-binding protein [Polaromonas sp.]